MNSVISEKIEELRQLCRLYSVRTMYVFGSAASGDFDSASDIDLLISFEDIPIDEYSDNYFELHYRLQELFKRRVDLLTNRSLSNPYFIKEVEQTRQLIYAA